MTKEWVFPWAEDTYGPEESVEFEAKGVEVEVSVLEGESGLYKIYCKTCPKTIHHRTCDATLRLREHMRVQHGVEGI